MKWNSSVALLVSLALGLGLTALSCKGKSNPVNPGGADVTINIAGQLGSNSYSPNPDTVRVGQKVAWHNANGTTHTATANGGQFNTSNVSPGGNSGAIQMNTAGTFSYQCNIHPTMTGTLVVKP